MAGFGETLRQARAHKGVTLREAEQATRINRNHLAALEDENFSALPPLIYQRGIVRNYAVYLELDASSMLARFEEAQGGASPTTQFTGASVPPIDMPSHWAPNFAIIAFAVVLSAIVFAWGYSIWVTPGDESETGSVAATTTPGSEEIALATELPDRPAPPTIAPTQTPAPTATVADVASEVSGRQDDGGDNQIAGDTDEAPATETQSGYQTGIAISASSDIDLTLLVDGELVYEGMLPAGQDTGMFVGSTFSVTTSSQAQTNFINSCEGAVPVPMSDVDEPGELEFAAHEGSCPAPAE